MVWFDFPFHANYCSASFQQSAIFPGFGTPRLSEHKSSRAVVLCYAEFMAQIFFICLFFPPKSKPYKYLIIFAARAKDYFNIPSSIF